MNNNTFNFVSGIINCLLHYRSKECKDAFFRKMPLVQNPNVTDKEDLVYDREKADEFYNKCTPLTPETILSNKLLMRSDDELLAKRMFDDSHYICMVYNIGKRLRSEFKVGFRKNEVDYIKRKVVQMQKWAFAIAELNVVLSYRTIDEQGFVVIAEVLDGDNKFDKAMRIAQILYDYLGMNVGQKYVGFLPESKTSFCHDVCPMSFDENYLFGYLDEKGKFFGSFDCMKIEGKAEDILQQYEVEKFGDIHNETITFPYANDMMYFEEKKYDVIKTTGLELTIRAGIKAEKDWILPERQLEFTDEGIKVIYNNIDIKSVDNSISDDQIADMKQKYQEESSSVFTVIDKNGLFEPCNISKLKSLSEEYENKGLLDIPLMCIGGYQNKGLGSFVSSHYVLLRLKDIKNKEQTVNYILNDKYFKERMVMYFDCQEDNNDLCLVLKSGNTVKYNTAWNKAVDKLCDLSIQVYTYTNNEECLFAIPNRKTLHFVT